MYYIILYIILLLLLLSHARIDKSLFLKLFGTTQTFFNAPLNQKRKMQTLANSGLIHDGNAFQSGFGYFNIYSCAQCTILLVAFITKFLIKIYKNPSWRAAALKLTRPGRPNSHNLINKYIILAGVQNRNRTSSRSWIHRQGTGLKIIPFFQNRRKF